MNLIDLFLKEGKQYLMDAMPGGALNREVTPQGLLDATALATAPVPVVGDIAGGVADAKRLYDNPEERTPMNIGLSALGLLPFIPGATVFHGTPHLFNKFDSSKIGTGEGAQAYGQGLYLGENVDVAKGYAPRSPDFEDKLMKAYTKAERSGDYASAQVLEEFLTHSTPDQVAKNLSQFSGKDLKKAQKAYEFASDAFRKQKGSYLYQVDLPDEQIAKMLDYDKPLSKQPPAVRAWLSSPYNAYRDQLTANDVGGNEPTGAMILGKLQELMSEGKKNDVFTNAANFGAANASREMADAGIPGIRYLDEGSRGAGKGTSNFVVFPGMEDMLRIEQINNQPVESLFRSLGR